MGDSGTATTKTAVASAVLSFDVVGATLTYTIKKKPFIVTDSQVWDGINDTINGCR